jgi:hypothetical protein
MGESKEDKVRIWTNVPLQAPCGDLDRPQELGVLPSGPEIKLSTSTLVTLPIAL